MKYKYFTILFLAVSASLGHIAFSLEGNSSQSQSVSWWMESLPEASIIRDINSFQEDFYDISDSKQRLSNIENTFLESKKLLRKNRNEVEDYLQKLEIMRNDTEKSIENNREKKQQLEQNILNLENEKKHIQSRQEETKDSIKKIIINNSRIASSEKNNNSIFQKLLQKSFWEDFLQKDTLNIFQETASQLLERQKSLENELIELEKTLNSRILAKNQILTRLENYKEELSDTEEVKKEILSQTIHEERLQRKIEKVAIKKQAVTVKLEEKFAEYEKNLQTKMSEYNCESRKSSVCVWLSWYIQAEKELLTSSTSSEEWNWATKPDEGFWYHFRDQKYFTNMNTHHTWLDILVSAGKPIYAMSNGYILMKQNPKTNFPWIVIVKHSGWLMSMYIGVLPGNNTVFSQVKTGDIIATSREYNDHSGKNNVHIELYENGVQIDPLEKMDLSSVSPSMVPARYGWKYIDDLKKNQVSPVVADMRKQIGFFHLEWDTEKERQNNLLKTYASSDFKDRNVWVEESIAESVDPTFVLCVGLAESTLGKNLTTDGNIGNVWNTDSWARRDFDGPRTGIRAISSVVNNRFLWKYNSIDQLSGWWNPKGPIYASSQSNWHENIVKCMSAIKGKYVGNRTSFRLSRASLLMYEREWFLQKIQ